MPNDTKMFHIIVLLVFICVPLQIGCSNKVCECPPGKYLYKECAQETEQPICVECHVGTFSETTSSAMSCQDCQIACEQREIVIQNCTRLSNLICQCILGTYRTPGPHSVCLNHTSCPAGYGVIHAGNQSHDTKCTKCTSETFSSDESLTQACQPCRTCGSRHEEERKCNSSSDTVCKLKDCGKPTNPQNGKVILPARRIHGSVVNYSCEYGFILIGPPTRTCDAGVWTYWDPVCIIPDRHGDLETLSPILIVIGVIVVALVVVVIFLTVNWCKNKDLRCLGYLNCQTTPSDNDIEARQTDKPKNKTAKSISNVPTHDSDDRKAKTEAGDNSKQEAASLLAANDRMADIRPQSVEDDSTSQERVELQDKNTIVTATTKSLKDRHNLLSTSSSKVKAL